MPTRAPRRCTMTGCPGAAEFYGRCVTHRQERPRPKAQPRPSSTEQGYDYQWRKRSETYRRLHPWCEVTGCGDRSAHTDHVDGDNTNWERDNLQALCHSHHSSKTARHDGGFGNPRTPR
ncbi:MAG TPA: hypothetical protein VM677_29255 [Actinokineospora sp.]|nr:hypothetical protein [Actinokineospora sp.]